ncbi:family 78 glycoside hydrolase catalytic domain [Haloferula sp. A504]|uniref:family 78 glycoside hydrolase catalytic domain n=1 Tax=Haloferula sp. A504 TaxID=3373601 RepID=UPI0031C6A5FD|nr:glycoside hydrolase family 78 protein [Verrucomicrobiaceae bacterium E54]
MKIVLLLFFSANLALAHLTVGLEIEHREAPVGMDDSAPRLSWRLEGDTAELAQTACQVLVATKPGWLEPGKADLWDSGQLASPRAWVGYEGETLPSSSEFHWKVRTWSGGEASEWSEPQRVVTSIIGGAPSAPYISFKDTAPFHKQRNKLHLPPARYYRTTFKPDRKVVRAVAHATALGIYELHVNGAKVGDVFFAPGWTNYRKRAYYNTFDLTPLIKDGMNGIGAVVADGWYAGYVGYGKLVGYGPHKTGRNIYGKTPAVMVELHLTYDDGTSEVVRTGEDWKTSTGPEFEADFLMGEGYDARKEIPGWSTAGFDDSNWEPAILAEKNGSVIEPFSDKFVKNDKREFGFVRPPVLQAYPAQPVRIIEELPAKSVTEHKPGVFIFDLGQNIAGNIRLEVKGKPGQKIVLRYGEMLHPDGRLMTENLRQARATDTYICKGDPAGETWTPRFTFHGFQFVELTGLEEKPPLDTITGLVLHSDTPMTSGFECSDPVVNKIWQNAIWTQRGNWIDLPTDCPQRDERMGWTGDAQIYAASAAIHADVAAFFRKWLRELEDDVTPEGYYPSYAPYPFGHGGGVHGSAWSDAGIIVPHALWMATGDDSFFRDHWKAMTRFMEARKAQDPKLEGKAFGAPWGDWLNLDDPTPHPYVELAYFAKCTRMMMEMAAAAKSGEEVAKYRDWTETLRANFRRQYLQADGTIRPESQSAYVMALDCDLLTDPAERQRAGARLAELIRAKAGPKSTGMTTGFLGTKPLLPVLADTGHLDLAVATLQSRKYPSWGYEVKNGATTIWERWNSYTEEHGFGGPNGKMNAAMNSFSHYAFGAVTEWMFRDLAGIAPAEPGYSKIRLKPHFPSVDATSETDTISWIKAHHDSPHGRIAIHWKRQDDGSLLYEATVPPNTTAELILPKRSPWSGDVGGEQTLHLSPGAHRFEVN